MKGTFGLLALAGAALASPMPQAVTSMIAPSAPAPSGCTPSYSGTFEITVVNVTQSKRGLDARQQDGVLMCTLSGGVLKDQAGRTGYIAANNQFQFDNPIQAGAIYTSGWSVCANNTLALGGSAVFYQCLSGGFYNLYDKSQGGQCAAIYIEVMGMSGASSGASAPAPTMAPSASVSQISDGQPQATTGKPAVSQISDGQPQATTGKPMMVSQISDGQPQAPTGMPVSQISDGQPQAPKSSAAAVSQISDGQPQAPTASPVSQISDGQPQAPTAMPSPAVSQISDGQPQAPTASPVSQISDGQPQAPTGTPVSQISDGQPQAPTASPVSQISDGQPQAPTGTPVSQISDGQPQAPTATKQPVSQISDGQPQATTGVAPATFTGAAAPRQIGGSFAFVAGLVGAVALL